MTPRSSGTFSRACVGLVAILSVALVKELPAQVDPPVRRPIPDILRERNRKPATAARTLVAFNYRDGAWVAVSGGAWRASASPSIPDEMESKLDEFLGAGRTIDAIEFTPTGGWTIVAGGAHWTRNVAGEYYDELRKLAREGRRVRAVAFNPDDWSEKRGFVIVHDRGVVSRAIPSEMRSKLDEFDRKGHEIRVVEFTPTGGWTILTDRGNWTRGVGGTDATAAEIVEPGDALMAAGRAAPASPTSYFERLQEVDGRAGFSPWSVAFDPRRYADRKGYLILSADGYWAQDVPPRLAHWLESEAGVDGVYARTILPEDAGEPARADRSSEPAVVARTRTAIIDLQQIVIEEVQERPGDEPYVVVFPLRGRLGVRDRVHVFDERRMSIRSERNWAKAGESYDIPSEVGKVTFEDLEPFEVYGIVTVYGEKDPGTSPGMRYNTFESGVYRDDEGIFDVVVDRFDRAVPFDAEAPDYDDLSEANVRRVVTRVFDGLRRYFDDSFKSQIETTFEKYNSKGNGDDLLAVSYMFFMNAPGLTDEEVDEIGGAHALPPGPFGGGLFGSRSSGGFGIFALDMNRYLIRGEHRLFTSGGKR